MKVSMSKKIVFVIVSLLLISSFSVFTAKAATTRGAITISFDDGLQNQYDYAFPLMQARGMQATYYVNTARINTANFMNTYELQVLQNYGNEIGSHSNNHVEFPSISGSQLIQECQVSQNTLRSWGLTAKNFAYPDAARNSYTDSMVAQYYRSARWGYVGPFVMSFPTNQFLLPAIDGSVTLSADFSLVDQISAANGWGIIVFHDVSPGSGIWSNHIGTSDFQTFLNYVQAKGVAVLTIDQALNALPTQPPAPTPTPPPAPTPTPAPGPSPSGSSTTFGATSVGGTSTTFYTGTPRAVQYTPTSSGTVTDLMLYLTGSGHAQAAIYTNNGNAPGTLLAKSSSDTINSNGWHDFQGFNVAITAWTSYWLAFESDSSNLLFYYNNGGANYCQGTGYTNSYGTFPNQYGTLYSGSYSPSIYAIYH